MEWIIALILVMLVPIGLIFWWIPHCDAIGVRRTQGAWIHTKLDFDSAIRAAWCLSGMDGASVSHFTFKFWADVLPLSATSSSQMPVQQVSAEADASVAPVWMTKASDASRA
ncbi:MAG: hypothetical protein WA728_30635 [Xanthobacteraceae bacterium]